MVLHPEKPSIYSYETLKPDFSEEEKRMARRKFHDCNFIIISKTTFIEIAHIFRITRIIFAFLA